MLKKIFIIANLLLLLSTVSYARQKVVVINVVSGIGPAAASYIESSIKYAEEQKAEALIIQLNTPGGLLESTRDIISYILASKVAVVVYVAPSGARAGSAGVFITLSANIAVMAKGTNIGAAHPVGIGGEGGDSSKVMFEKVTNDAAAFIRSIAQRRHKNEEWAEKTVRQSISATENEALQAGAIDLIAPILDSLLIAINGMEVEIGTGKYKLETAAAIVEHREMDWREKLLGILSDPNFAYIFMMLAIYGILFELYNPGAIFPGIIGGIAAILAAYSLHLLPVNYAGLALIILAVILFLIEIKVVSHGLLAAGGTVSLLLGSLMLIDSPTEFVSISMGIIITVVVLSALFFSIVLGLGIKAQTRRKASGKEGLIGETGTAQTIIEPNKTGRVHIHGEIWKAVSNERINEGEGVAVVAVEGMVLRVRRI
jgi:membrane-bound serine protease (ClpP class)